MSARSVAWALIGVGLVVALSACGSGEEAGRFDDDVQAVRRAIDAGDATAVDQALDTLALDALAAQEDGTIDAAELDEVAQLVAAVRATAAELVPAPTTTTTTTTTTTAPPPPVIDEDEEEDDDDERGRGKDKKDRDED